MALPGESVKLQGRRHRTLPERTKQEYRGQYLASELSMRIEMRRLPVLLRVNLIRLLVRHHLSLRLFVTKGQPLVYREILRLQTSKRPLLSQKM
jgi:hypothetical protein